MSHTRAELFFYQSWFPSEDMSQIWSVSHQTIRTPDNRKHLQKVSYWLDSSQFRLYWHTEMRTLITRFNLYSLHSYLAISSCSSSWWFWMLGPSWTCMTRRLSNSVDLPGPSIVRVEWPLQLRTSHRVPVISPQEQRSHWWSRGQGQDQKCHIAASYPASKLRFKLFSL